MRQESFDLEKRINETERLIQLAMKDFEQETEGMRNLIQMHISKKADFRDLDQIA